MKEKFMRFMQGRYGVLDTLGKVLLVLGLVLAFFAPVFSGDHVIGLSYLYLSGMQAENPDSERQRKDRDPLSEVRDNIYQEELRLHKGIEHKGEQTKDNDRSISCVGSITRCF